MPTSGRKSSFGGRRGPDKPHEPYREAGLIGRKTGQPVPMVEPDSDDIEPFKEVIGMAKARTPKPNPNKKRKVSVPKKSMVFEDEDSDEQSMELASPLARRLSNTHQPVTPSHLSRPGTSRAVARSSGLNYDGLPSPRSRPSRKSAATSYGSTRLSQVLSASGYDDDEPAHTTMDLEPLTDSPQNRSFHDIDQDEEDEDLAGQGGYTMPDLDDPLTGIKRAPRPSSKSNRQDSGSDEDGEEQPPPTDEEQEQESPRAARARQAAERKNKGKARAEPQSDEEMEPEADVGMDNVDAGEPGGSITEEEEPTPRPKKRKAAPEKPQRKVLVQSMKENRDVPMGVRRSKRQHIAPLEWWRNEKMVYARPEHGTTLVANIKEIIRIPKEPVEPLGKKRGARRAQTRSKSTAAPDDESEWDSMTVREHAVFDYVTGESVVREIAFTSSMFNPKFVGNNKWLFEKVFSEGDYMAAGQLVIPVAERKPSKQTKDNTYVFIVLEGVVNLKLNGGNAIFARHGSFMVPRGNTYFIENIGEGPATLFFVQARKTPVEDMIREQNEIQKRRAASSAGGSRRASTSRSS